MMPLKMYSGANLGRVPARSESHYPVAGGDPLDIGLEAVALGFVCVQEGRGVELATDRGQLLVSHLENVGGQIEAQLVVRQNRLDADFKRGVLFGVGRRHTFLGHGTKRDSALD